MLVYVAMLFRFLFLALSQRCAHTLARLRHKNHLVMVKWTSWFGFECLFWWLQTQLWMFQGLLQNTCFSQHKHGSRWPDFQSKNIQFCSSSDATNMLLYSLCHVQLEDIHGLWKRQLLTSYTDDYDWNLSFHYSCNDILANNILHNLN